MATLLRVAAMSLMMGVAAFAKLPMVKMSLSGDGLAQPIEVTDATILRNFNPIGDGFVDLSRPPLSGAPEGSAVAYEVLFYLEADVEDAAGRRFLMQRRYALRYYRDPETGQGYIYRPTKDEIRKRPDAKLIVIRNLDGLWHHASPDWDRLIGPLVNR
jgi:hypothetical protein